MFWPVLVVLLIMALAYALFRMLPEIIDQGSSFLWIVGVFLLVYIGAAVYLSHSLPALGQSSPGGPTVESSETLDVVKTPDRL